MGRRLARQFEMELIRLSARSSQERVEKSVFEHVQAVFPSLLIITSTGVFCI